LAADAGAAATLGTAGFVGKLATGALRAIAGAGRGAAIFSFAGFAMTFADPAGFCVPVIIPMSNNE
jgi:hypothetical protein